MRIREILNTTEHRPWKLPDENWKFYQEWNDAIFLHWQVDLEDLREFVPQELEIDLFEGKPWVSVVAFTMEKIRPKNLPAFSPVSNFQEINIRTYVKSNGKTGVYFLSIEGGSKLSCKIAKGVSELPYRFSTIKRSENLYESSNSEFGDKLKIEYEHGREEVPTTELDKWLIERYALFQDTKKSINEFEIHHLPWTVHELKIKFLEVSYPRFSRLLKGGPHRICYSKGVQVIAWGKKKNERGNY
ncbi:uncharacterized protein YqjF (DUF2071 family) [Algoriphagus sp. 4150]|uniref:YqjF family protein n=1 Tax=Algoriphagus sp. 4150 TaxID=2817756 RepID=UPI0028621C72|nr:DUF2071 domain-containing protein [Algoriphagus sp. 4150]MDR7127899.1 uncharacterized protein YqjF (DUF2071 family) [Algoriphagus sp. 4150]